MDAIVIGAGIVGSSTCLELSRRGRSVVCVDAGPAVGAGSTSSSSAIIRLNYSIWNSVLLAWESLARWEDFSGHLGLGDDTGLARYVSTGCLILDSPGIDRRTVLELLDRVGIDYEEWDPDELVRRCPALDNGDYSPPKPIDDPAFGADPSGTIGGYYIPASGFVDDPMLAAVNFMDVARAHGTDLKLNNEVVEIRSAGGAVEGVTLASGERIDAPVVVNVAGPASSLLNRMAGVEEEMRIRTRPLRQEVHVTEAPLDFTISAGGVLVADMGVGTYFRPHLGDTVLVGGTEPECDELEWIEDPTDFDDRPTVDGFMAQMMRAARRLPGLEIPLRPRGLAALYDASDDWAPVYDRSSLEGFFMACGTSGNQFKNAPITGILMAELVEAADRGIDHDADPVHWTGTRSGLPIDIGAFSRLRDPASTTGTVMG